MSHNRVVSAVAVGAVTLAVVAIETVAGRRFSRRFARAIARTARYQSGHLAGFRYRLAGREPDPAAESRVLADRIHHEPVPVYERSDETAWEALLPNVGSEVLPLASVG
jgi:hypothetical protein